MKNNNGVTLIALVITIIVLLILAGVALSMIMGDSGIFGKANSANNKTRQSQALEDVRLLVLETKTRKEGNATLVDVMEQIEQSHNTYLVKTESSATAKLDPSGIQVADITAETEEIYVTNMDYGEEVKIDKDLKAELTGAEVSVTPTTPPTESTITYNANGGSGEMTPTTGINPEVAANTFTKANFTFKGWNTAEDGTGTNVEVGTNVTADTTLYAQWQKTVYSVGDIVTLGGEDFYVIEASNESATTVKLLAKYNVITTSGTGQYTQSSNANYLAFDNTSPYSNSYASSEIKPHVDAYKTALEGRMGSGKTTQEVRLMTKGEVVALGGNESSGVTGPNLFLREQSYWLSTPHDRYDLTWRVLASYSGFYSSTVYSDNICGMRPVVVVLKSNI